MAFDFTDDEVFELNENPELMVSKIGRFDYEHMLAENPDHFKRIANASYLARRENVPIDEVVANYEAFSAAAGYSGVPSDDSMVINAEIQRKRDKAEFDATERDFKKGIMGVAQTGAASLEQELIEQAFGNQTLKEVFKENQLKIQQEEEVLSFLTPGTRNYIRQKDLIDQKKRLTSGFAALQAREAKNWVDANQVIEGTKFLEGYKKFKEGGFGAIPKTAKGMGEFFVSFMVEQTVRQVPSIARTVTAGPMSPLVAGAEALKGETSAGAVQFLRDSGVDFNDEESILAAFNNEKLMKDAQVFGLRKGAVVSLFAMISAGINPTGGALTRAASETGSQAALDFTGETLGQLAQTGTFNLEEALLEVLGGTGQSVAEGMAKISSSLISKSFKAVASKANGEPMTKQDWTLMSESVSEAEVVAALEQQYEIDLIKSALDGDDLSQLQVAEHIQDINEGKIVILEKTTDPEIQAIEAATSEIETNLDVAEDAVDSIIRPGDPRDEGIASSEIESKRFEDKAEGLKQQVNDVKVAAKDKAKRVAESVRAKVKQLRDDLKHLKTQARDDIISQKQVFIDASRQLAELVNALPKRFRQHFNVKAFETLTKRGSIDSKLKFLDSMETRINTIFETQFKKERKALLGGSLKRATKGGDKATRARFGDDSGDLITKARDVFFGKREDNLERLDDISLDRKLSVTSDSGRVDSIGDFMDTFMSDSIALPDLNKWQRNLRDNVGERGHSLRFSKSDGRTKGGRLGGVAQSERGGTRTTIHVANDKTQLEQIHVIGHEMVHAQLRKLPAELRLKALSVVKSLVNDKSLLKAVRENWDFKKGQKGNLKVFEEILAEHGGRMLAKHDIELGGAFNQVMAFLHETMGIILDLAEFAFTGKGSARLDTLANAIIELDISTIERVVGDQEITVVRVHGDPQIRRSFRSDEGLDPESERALISTMMAAGAKDATSEDINAAIDMVKNIAKDGKDFMKSFKQSEANRAKGFENQFVNEMLGAEPLKPAVVLEHEKSKNAFKKGFKFVKDGLENFIILKNEGLELLLDSLKITGARFSGFARDNIFTPVFNATKSRNKIIRETTLAFGDASRDALIDVFPEIKKSAKKAKEIIDGLSISQLSSVKFNPEGKASDGVINVPLTKWEATTIWMQRQDKSLHERMDLMGLNDTQINNVVKFIGPEGVKIGKYLLAQYEANGNRVQDATREVNGFAIPLVENYSPTSSFRDESKSSDIMDDNLGMNEFITANAENGSLKSRTGTKAALRFLPADKVFQRHTTQTEHYIAFARIAKDINLLITSNAKVRQAIKQRTGSDSHYDLLKGILENVIRGNIERSKVDTFFAKAAARVATANIALNFTSSIKQWVSIPALSDAMAPGSGVGSFTAGINRFFRDFKGNTAMLMKSDYIQNRLRGGHERDIKEAMNKTLSMEMTNIKSWPDRMMFMTRFGDIGAILVGGFPVYESWNSHFSKTMSPQDAHNAAMLKFEQAADRSQQSGELYSLGYWQSLGSMAKLFTMFLTTPIQYNRIMFNAITASKAGRISKTELAKTLILYHVILPQLFTGISSAFIAFWGDEEEKEELYNRHLTTLVLGNFGSLFIAGQVLEGIASRMFGGDGQGDVGSPVFDSIEKAIDAADAAGDGEYLELADLIAEMVATTQGLPYKPVKKIYDGLMSEEDDVTKKTLRVLGWSEHALGQSGSSKKTKDKF